MNPNPKTLGDLASTLSVCPCISQRGRGEKTRNTAEEKQTGATGAGRLALVPVTCESAHGTMMIYTNKHDQHVKRKPHQNHGGRRE